MLESLSALDYKGDTELCVTKFVIIYRISTKAHAEELIA